ncbi:SLC13 family permease [Vibrio algivorus]|uniref:SLC13 family permease n=1 Tax=Vibrio algivorus TaxID=1667024 RepID=A0A557P5M2_9VIBR|nr:SLC13 family permease [Vibrio algivorus]TVO35960.1 SLC13 family permease [Vibrio algivorus]
MLITGSVIIGLLLLLMFTRISPARVFALAVMVLYVAQVLSKETVIDNLTNSSILVLLGLVIASFSLEKTRLLPWISTKIFSPSYVKTVFKLGFFTAFSSAFLNNTAVVATLMRAVQRNQEHSTARLLLPLSYFAILGGTLTLIGTSTNLVIDGLLRSMQLPGLNFLDFLPVGLLLVICGGVVVCLVSLRLGGAKVEPSNQHQYFIDAEVKPGSNLVGKTVLENQLRALDGLFLVEIARNNSLISPVNPQCVLRENDKLIFAGDVSQVSQLQAMSGLDVFADSDELLSSNLQEVIVSPASVLVGKTLKETGFRARFDAAVVAISRHGHALSGKLGEQVIASGDKLVLAVGPDFHKRQNLTRNFFLLSDIKVLQTLSAWQNIAAIGGFLGAIGLSAFHIIPLLDAVVAYVTLMLVTKVIDSTTIRRRFPFDLWVILVCALCVASAFQSSGLSDWVSSHIVELLGNASPLVALSLIFFTTLLLTEIITNSAAAAIMLPVGLSLAASYQVDIMPFIMTVAYAASASFLSPYGYQTNLMVMNAGGYQFSDFIKAGWPLTITYSAVSLLAIPYFFPF